MLKLHCLAYSRSLRVAWLLEELEVPYDLVFYERTDRFRAPQALRGVHPLGRSPVIEDDGLMLAESSAILRYIDTRYGSGSFEPAPASRPYFEHAEWLDFAESSAATPIITAALEKASGKEEVPQDQRVKAQLADNFDYIEARLADRPFLMGEAPMLADIQMSYLMAVAEMAGLLEARPDLAAYWQRLQERPGFRAATAKAGPMAPQRR